MKRQVNWPFIGLLAGMSVGLAKAIPLITPTTGPAPNPTPGGGTVPIGYPTPPAGGTGGAEVGSPYFVGYYKGYEIWCTADSHGVAGPPYYAYGKRQLFSPDYGTLGEVYAWVDANPLPVLV